MLAWWIAKRDCTDYKKGIEYILYNHQVYYKLERYIYITALFDPTRHRGSEFDTEDAARIYFTLRAWGRTLERHSAVCRRTERLVPVWHLLRKRGPDSTWSKINGERKLWEGNNVDPSQLTLDAQIDSLRYNFCSLESTIGCWTLDVGPGSRGRTWTLNLITVSS